MHLRTLASLLLTVCAASRGLGSPDRHAVLRFQGDLDNVHATDRFVQCLDELEHAGADLILIEINGNGARADLLVRAIDALRELDAMTAVYLSDQGDRRVGPGQVALALAADRASISPFCGVRREIGDGLEHLNPEIQDWAVLGLDLRTRAKAIAKDRDLPIMWTESLVAPRSEVWIRRSDSGTLTPSDEPGAGGVPVVTRSAEGWTFSLEATETALVFGFGIHRSPRSHARSAGARGRPLSEIEITSDLKGAHERCLLLIRDVRAAIELADSALDIYSHRRGRASILPRDYHEAADKADALVTQSREAIRTIKELTDQLGEILEMEPPADARSPTEIGGPSRSPKASWRDAVRDAERELSYLDERIADYRRR